MTFSWIARALVLVGAVAVGACGGKDDGGTPTPSQKPIVLGPDVTNADITWNPDTVIVDADAIAANLKNPYAEDGVYRFDPAAAEIAALSPGQVVVLTGVDLVRVTAVEVTDDAIVLTTEPASLPDAASDAEISWDVGVDLSEPIQRNEGDGMLRPLTKPEVRCSLEKPDACETQFSGSLGNLKTTQKLQTEPNGSLKMSLSMEYPIQESSVLKVSLDSHVRSFRHEGSFVVHGGNLESAYVTLRDIEIDVDLDAGAVAIGGGENLFKLPLKLTFPFELGPIPAYITISGEISLNPALSNESALRAHTKFYVSGTTGFTMDSSTISASGSLSSVGGAAPTASNVSYISTVNAGYGVVYSFPRIGLGIGLIDKASVEGFVTPKFEFVMNQALKLDGLGLINSSCTTIKGNYGVFAGGSFRLGKIQLGQETQLFGAVHDIYKDGRANGKADPKACN